MTDETPTNGEIPASGTDADVVIVGGGLVGLSLAVAVAGAGLSTVVIDRDDPAAVLDQGFDGRVSAIAFASQQLLQATGVWDRVAEAQPILDIRVTDGASPLFLHYDHRQLGDAPFGHMVENRVLRVALHKAAEACPNLVRLAPAGVIGFERSAAGVTVNLADGRTVRAPLIVGAEGRNSPTRRAAGIGTVGWSYGQTGIVCTVHHDRPHHGVAHERFLPAGPFAILPMTGNRSSLVWTEPTDVAAAIMALDDAAFLDELRDRFGDFLGALNVTGPRWSYPLTLQNAERYTDHRLVLVGDAAHGMHPIAGQGLNLGLRDVAALAEVLVDRARLGLDLGARDGLERYERWRRFDSVALLAVTDGLNRLFSNDVMPVRVARDLGLAAVDRMPALKGFFMRHARGTVGKLPRLLAGSSL